MKRTLIALAILRACTFSAGAFAQSDESWGLMHQNAELENLADAVDHNSQAVSGSQGSCQSDKAELARLQKLVRVLQEANRRGLKIVN